MTAEKELICAECGQPREDNGENCACGNISKPIFTITGEEIRQRHARGVAAMARWQEEEATYINDHGRVAYERKLRRDLDDLFR